MKPAVMKTIVYKSVIPIFLLICSSALITACDNSKSKGQPSARPAPKVGVTEIKTQSLVLTTELAGRTSAFLMAEVRPQVSGIILQRSFEEGSEVTRGQSLYQIDPASYQAKLDVATAELARDEAALTTAKLKARRYKNLLASKDISQEAYDDADAAYKQAIASVAIGKAAIETAKIDLAYTKIKAPASGRIGRSSVTQGALVTADQTMPLATIQQLDPIYVDLTQSSTDLLKLKRALDAGHLEQPNPLTTKVDLILDDGSHYPLPGKIQFSEVSVNESTGTVTLRARFPNPDHLLLPGMFVRAIVEEGVDPNAILVPQQAVTRDPKGNASALVLNAENKVELHHLIVDRAIGNQWLISKGLSAGDRLIVDGFQKIRPGASAQAVAWTAPATTNDTSKN